MSEDEVTVVVQNPSYSVLPSSTTLSTPQYHKRGRGSIIVFGNDVLSTEPTAVDDYFEKTGSSSKWDHHITSAVLATIVASLCLNPCALGCGIAAVYFSVMARIASRNNKHEEKLENERTAFAFFIVCIITIIVTVCIVSFTLYETLCGRTGVNCRF